MVLRLIISDSAVCGCPGGGEESHGDSEKEAGMADYLCDMKPGQNASVLEICEERCRMAQRLRDLGFISGAGVTCIQESPLGDPVAFRVRGTVIALRKEDAAAVQVRFKEREEEMEEEKTADRMEVQLL